MVGNVQHSGLQIGTQGVDDRSWVVHILIALSADAPTQISAASILLWTTASPCILYLATLRPTLSDIEDEISSCLCNVHTALGKP